MNRVIAGGRTRRGRGQTMGHGALPCAASALLLALLVLLTGAMPVRVAAAQENDGTATVRVVHGAADAGAVDLYVDGSLAVAGIAFPSVSDPLTLPAGEHELRIVASGAAPEDALVVADVDLEPSLLYEAAALGTIDDLQANLYEIDLDPLAAGLARLRLIHGSPDAGPLTLAAGDAADAVLPAVEFPNETEALELDAGAYDIEIRNEDGSAAVSLGGLQLEAGVVYDLFAIGRIEDDSLQVLAVVAQPNQAPAPDARPAALYAGACAEDLSDLGEVVSPLNGPAPPAGEPLGQDGAAQAASSVTAVGLPFDDLLAADHAIAVLAADDDPSVVSCGVVGGTVTANGALVVGLREANGSGVAGLAILAPSALDTEATDVSVFVADGLVGDGADEPPVSEATADPEPEPTEEAAATPEAGAVVVAADPTEEATPEA